MSNNQDTRNKHQISNIIFTFPKKNKYISVFSVVTQGQFTSLFIFILCFTFFLLYYLPMKANLNINLNRNWWWQNTIVSGLLIGHQH